MQFWLSTLNQWKCKINPLLDLDLDTVRVDWTLKERFFQVAASNSVVIQLVQRLSDREVVVRFRKG